MNRIVALICCLGFLAAGTAFGQIETITPGTADEQKSGEFVDVDLHALNAPASAERSVRSLALYLKEGAADERQLARAFYRWITRKIQYDVNAFFSGKYGDLSPEGVLRSRKGVCSGYARLFEALAKETGLTAVTVEGYSKGYGFTAGQGVSGNPNHAWTAVKIKGIWKLIDCTWGSGYIDNNKKFVYHFTEHYFLVPPEAFIFDHFPADARWQLLERPLSAREYSELVYLRPAFFKGNMRIVSHNKSIVHSAERVTLEFDAPEETLVLPQVLQNDREIGEQYAFAQRNGERISVSLVFPRAGDYVFRLFAKVDKGGSQYDWALDYRIIASDGAGRDAGFPKVYGDFIQKKVYLFEPLDGLLKKGSEERFKLRIPGAEQAAVIVDGKWNMLTKQGELFEGPAAITGSKAGVYAKYPGQGSFSALLDYRVR